MEGWQEKSAPMVMREVPSADAGDSELDVGTQSRRRRLDASRDGGSMLGLGGFRAGRLGGTRREVMAGRARVSAARPEYGARHGVAAAAALACAAVLQVGATARAAGGGPGMGDAGSGGAVELSSCKDKCQEKYLEDCAACGKIDDDEANKDCQTKAYERQKKCQMVCAKQGDDCLDHCKDKCVEQWERCFDGCDSNDFVCMEKCMNALTECMKECERKCK